MVVNRYMDGKPIPEIELANIKLTDNSDIAEIIDRVVARVNNENGSQKISTNNIPA